MLRLLFFSKTCTWSSKSSALLSAWNSACAATELVFLACCSLNFFLWLNSPNYISKHKLAPLLSGSLVLHMINNCHHQSQETLSPTFLAKEGLLTPDLHLSLCSLTSGDGLSSSDSLLEKQIYNSLPSNFPFTSSLSHSHWKLLSYFFPCSSSLPTQRLPSLQRLSDLSSVLACDRCP